MQKDPDFEASLGYIVRLCPKYKRHQSHSACKFKPIINPWLLRVVLFFETGPFVSQAASNLVGYIAEDHPELKYKYFLKLYLCMWEYMCAHLIQRDKRTICSSQFSLLSQGS